MAPSGAPVAPVTTAPPAEVATLTGSVANVSAPRRLATTAELRHDALRPLVPAETAVS
jgi:hypothetical protein